MSKLLLSLSFLASFGASAYAQTPAIAVSTENILRKGTWVEAHFSAANGGSIPMKNVVVSCTFFDDGKKPLATETGIISNVQPKEKAFGKAMAKFENGMTGANCRLDNAYPF